MRAAPPGRLHFVREEEADALQALLAPVHVIPQEPARQNALELVHRKKTMFSFVQIFIEFRWNLVSL